MEVEDQIALAFYIVILSSEYFLSTFVTSKFLTVGIVADLILLAAVQLRSPSVIQLLISQKLLKASKIFVDN